MGRSVRNCLNGGRFGLLNMNQVGENVFQRMDVVRNFSPASVERKGSAVQPEGFKDEGFKDEGFKEDNRRRTSFWRKYPPDSGGFPGGSGLPEAEVKAHLQVDGCSGGHKKQPNQQPPERLDIRLDLRPVVGFGQEGTSKKSAQLQGNVSCFIFCEFEK
jgi:hypothetical protein